MKPLLVTLACTFLLAQQQPPQFEPGTLPPAWRSGGPVCAAVPDWQVHEYNADFWILRESGCINYEKPFLYLIFGSEKALLEDTGAGDAHAAAFVQQQLENWARRHNRPAPRLTVIHSHGHGDHTAGDKDFQAMPNVDFIPATREAVNETPQIDLGNRILDVVPIPGHHEASIALYDRKTALLLTGDSLYPGRLYVTDFAEFAGSAARLEEFVRTRPVAHVLGTHIEQTRAPYHDYTVGTKYQPDEHSLELSRAHVLELAEAFRSLNGKPGTVLRPDFTVMPRPTRGE